jgi:uncharacterized membrane protein
MATLSALRFSGAGGHEAALAEVRTLNGSGRLVLSDLAIMSWSPERRLPDMRTASFPAEGMPMGERFWNLLFSHVFLLPLAAAEAGVPAQSARCLMASLGIHDDFLQTARDCLGPGSSALFLLTNDATVDPVIRSLANFSFTVMSTNLSRRQLDALRTAFWTGPLDGPDEQQPASGARTLTPLDARTDLGSCDGEGARRGR